MICRSLPRSNASLAARSRTGAQPSQRRGFAAVASGSFQYGTGDAAGVKIASRDLTGPTTTLALVAKAGTRYQTLPGLSDGLEKFAFKGTQKRSALRINREVELLGGTLGAYHSRENLVLGAKFLRDDLPYFVELLGEVATKTKYTAHEFREEVVPTIKLAQKALLANPTALASNSAHGVAFHRGLGTPLHPTSSTPFSKYLHPDTVADFASVAYAKPNIAVVANGASQANLSKWVGEFFTDAPSTSSKLQSAPSKYHGGEERIAHDAGNAMIIGFPGSSSFTAGGSYKPEIAVLATLLGGESSIKWSTGFSLLAKAAASHPGAHVSTSHAAYSDAGLLQITLTGSAKDIRGASVEAVKALKKVAAGDIAKEEITKAVALAKFRALDAGQTIEAGLELTGAGLVQAGKAFQMDEIAKGIDGVSLEHVKKITKSLLDGKATVSTVGDLYLLPFAEEIGLTV
ncbi:MAG: ubiquinol-cytochrome c reductase core subunit 1 [Thelocarpon impressellum]|nr:MAG: ubiquinol-cytochrome c reductase core subunit 1 [Thelocarpon impressellum]